MKGSRRGSQLAWSRLGRISPLVAAGCWSLPLVLGTMKAVCEESEKALGERERLQEIVSISAPE